MNTQTYNNWIKLNNNYNPITVNDTINNKCKIIHNNLYKNALYKYIEELSYLYNKNISEILSTYKFIELKDYNKEYYEPSEILKISKIKPFNKEKIDLTDYWDNEYILSNKSSQQLLYDKYTKDNINSSEIEYYDYIKGKVKIRNRITDKVKTISFSDINKNMNINKK